MASALVGGLLKQGWPADDCAWWRSTRKPARQCPGSSVSARVPVVPERLEPQEVVVLAVKPQTCCRWRAICARLSSQLVVTIAAGIRTQDLSRWLGGYENIVRVMPNTPALVLAGISALYAMPAVDVDARRHADSILSAVGATIWVEREELMDAVTAVSGSGPAYVFYFMEAIMRAAEGLGLSPEQARRLTLETFYGAASLARQSSESPAALRIRVTSKGGTTERALSAMDAAAIQRHVVDAVQQAAARSRELGEQLGSAD
jgi:pyrroline-5-carboxylate reductase